MRKRLAWILQDLLVPVVVLVQDRIVVLDYVLQVHDFVLVEDFQGHDLSTVITVTAVTLTPLAIVTGSTLAELVLGVQWREFAQIGFRTHLRYGLANIAPLIKTHSDLVFIHGSTLFEDLVEAPVEEMFDLVVSFNRGLLFLDHLLVFLLLILLITLHIFDQDVGFLDLPLDPFLILVVVDDFQKLRYQFQVLVQKLLLEILDQGEVVIVLVNRLVSKGVHMLDQLEDRDHEPILDQGLSIVRGEFRRARVEVGRDLIGVPSQVLGIDDFDYLLEVMVGLDDFVTSPEGVVLFVILGLALGLVD